MYTDPMSCVQINGYLGKWFKVKSGVRQGDSLSPTLFSIFINDLAQSMRDVEGGVMIQNEMLSLLMYADDIVLLSENTPKAQCQLDVM